MYRFPAMSVEQTQILTRGELACVLKHGKQDALRSANAWRNLIIVRLACCCGLRVSEIAGLQLDEVGRGRGTASPAAATRDHQGQTATLRAAMVGC